MAPVEGQEVVQEEEEVVTATAGLVCLQIRLKSRNSLIATQISKGQSSFFHAADGSVEALLAAAGKSLDQLPKDLVEGIKAGRVR